MGRGLDRKIVPLLLQGLCLDPGEGAASESLQGTEGSCLTEVALPLAGSGESVESAPSPLSGQIVKKSCYPRWNETFEFELEEGATEALCVEAWDWDLVSRNDFLGKVSTLPLQVAPVTFSTWPPFQPSHSSSSPKRGTQETWDSPELATISHPPAAAGVWDPLKVR